MGEMLRNKFKRTSALNSNHASTRGATAITCIPELNTTAAHESQWATIVQTHLANNRPSFRFLTCNLKNSANMKGSCKPWQVPPVEGPPSANVRPNASRVANQLHPSEYWKIANLLSIQVLGHGTIQPHQPGNSHPQIADSYGASAGTSGSTNSSDNFSERRYHWCQKTFMSGDAQMLSLEMGAPEAHTLFDASVPGT